MSTTHKHDPGPIVIITKAIDHMASSADNLEEALGPATRVMTPDYKRRALRIRKGAHLVTQTIATLARSYGLDSTALHSDQMLALVQKAGTLSAAEARITKLLKRVSDERYLASADAWDQALQFYALLQRRALSDGQLAQNLSSIEDFFAYRHGSVEAKKPTKLQTRAKKKLAQAERLVVHANERGRVQAASPAVPAPTAVPTPAAPAPAPTPPPAHAAPNGQPAPNNGQT
jgi:hypothetical protein